MFMQGPAIVPPIQSCSTDAEVEEGVRNNYTRFVSALAFSLISLFNIIWLRHEQLIVCLTVPASAC